MSLISDFKSQEKFIRTNVHTHTHKLFILFYLNLQVIQISKTFITGKVVTDPGSCTLQPIQMKNRPDEECRQGFTGAGGNKEQCPWLGPGATAGAGRSEPGPLNGVKVVADPQVGLEQWLRWSAHPFGGTLCEDPVLSRTPLLLPKSQKHQLGFWSFCIVLFIICFNCACSYF